MNNLNNIINNYIRFVFNWDEDDEGERWNNYNKNDPKFEEYLEEEFKFSAVNNWFGGFDIVDWYEGNGDYDSNGHYGCGHQGYINNLIDFETACVVVRIIIKYFEEQYGECSKEFLTDFSIHNVIRNYAYVYVDSMSIEELKSILSIE